MTVKPELLEKYNWIMSDPKVLGGKPVVKGTRIPVTQVLRCLSHGMNLDEIREMYGDFPNEAISEVLQFASAVLDQEQANVAS